MTNIFVAGKNGLLALSLAELASDFNATVCCYEPPELDLTNSEATYKMVMAAQPDIIINAAAYTAVDAAEENETLAYAINFKGAEALAKAAADLDVPFLHVSTDYVYSGDKDGAYIETDPTGPTGVYGASKLAGDHAVLNAHNKACVFRTAWVYSPYGKNFIKTMLWLAENKDEVGIVADQHGNPTSALDIARSLLNISAKIIKDGWHDDYKGIYHLTGSGDTSWHGFASYIFDEAHRQFGHKKPSKVNALTTEQYPTPASRPANSVLNCDKLKAVFGIRLPAWQDSTKDCINRLLEEKS